MIKNMVKVPILGVMVVNIQGNGQMVNSMVKVYIDMQMDIVEQVFGMRVREQCGLTSEFYLK